MPSVDEATFASLVERHRRELHVHCYRMMGSFEEAEDLVQQTLLRAWRARERIEGGAIAAITTFDATLFPAFGLPPVYPSDAGQRP